MRQFETGGNTYRVTTLDAFKQLHVARRLAPIMSALLQSDEILAPVAAAIAKMQNDEVEYVVRTCLSVCQRRQLVGQQETWAPVVANNGSVLFADITLQTMLELTKEVVDENLLGFFATASQTSSPKI